MALDLTNHTFSDTLVILGAAGLVIPAFTRFRISPVIGFILVGALVGPAGLGQLVPQLPWLYYVTITDPHSIEPFAEFGIILLLFSIGLELSFRRLWTMRTLVFGVGAAELLGAGLLIAAGLYFLGQSWTGALGLGDQQAGEQRADDRGQADCGGCHAGHDDDEQAGGEEQLGALGARRLGEHAQQEEAAAEEQHRDGDDAQAERGE